VDGETRMGRFVLTGSQEFGLRAGITQSLAGRVRLVHLLPLSLHELAGVDLLPASPDTAMLRGGYPPLHDRDLAPRLWFPNYVNTYLERDVPRLLEVRNREQFQRFVRLCAAHTGQLLNLSAIGSDCGVSHVTAKEWLNVLEASYLVVRVPLYFRNFGKRLVKRPKPLWSMAATTRSFGTVSKSGVGGGLVRGRRSEVGEAVSGFGFPVSGKPNAGIPNKTDS